MKFFKFSMLAILFSFMVGLAPSFFNLIFGDNSRISASVVKFQSDRLSTNKNSSDSLRVLIAGNTKIPVYIADSEQERIKGLSGMKSLPTLYGMFFTFDSLDYQGIWMKDMIFPIDIVWIDENQKIVHIERDISPKTFPKIFVAPKKSRFVLELNANMTNDYGLKIGDALILKSE